MVNYIKFTLDVCTPQTNIHKLSKLILSYNKNNLLCIHHVHTPEISSCNLPVVFMALSFNKTYIIIYALVILL